MKGKKDFILCSFIIISILITTTCAISLEKLSHSFLHEIVVKNKKESLNTYLNLNLGISNGVQEIVDGKSISTWLIEGGVKEDEPHYIRSFGHYHDPLKPWEVAGYKSKSISSVIWAQNQTGVSPLIGGDQSWNKARNSIYKGLTDRTKSGRDKYFAETFQALGQVMHLIQDASVPAHTRDDAHVVGFHYEKWVAKNHHQLDLKPKPFHPSILSIKPDLAAPIPISNIFDTNKYKGLGYLDIAAGTNIGISEFTNANYFSEETPFRSYPHPRYEDTNISTIDWKNPERVEAEDGKHDRRIYIAKTVGEPVKRLASVSYLSLDLFKKGSKLLYFVLDDNVYKDYASSLIPRAVGYSAGLLEYFFRGKLDFKQSGAKPNGEIEITITNLSGEPLIGGEFELYYDNPLGERTKINLSRSKVEKEAPIPVNGTFLTTFTPPIRFVHKKKDWYMLVYKGQLGDEMESVIGKYQLIQNAVPVMVSFSSTSTYSFDLYKYVDHYRILFKPAKKTQDDSSLNFYIDLTDIFKSLGHTPDLIHALRVVEQRSNFGVIIYFGISEGSDEISPYYGLGTGNVIKFKVTTQTYPEQIFNADGEDYKKFNFEYRIEQFDLSDNAIKSGAPPINVSHGFWNRSPDLKTRRHYPTDGMNANCVMFAATYCAGGLRTGEATGGGAYSSLGNLNFSWYHPGAYCFDWTGQKTYPFTVQWDERASAQGVEAMGAHRRNFFTGDTLRWIWPIGSGVWLNHLRNESLDELNWEIKLSTVLRYKYRYKSSRSVSATGDTAPCEFYDYGYNEQKQWVRIDLDFSWDDAVRGVYGGPTETEGYEYFTLPIILSAKNGGSLTHEDPQGLLGAAWAYDRWVTKDGVWAVPQVLPVLGPVAGESVETYREGYGEAWQEMGVRYHPILKERPGRYIKAWPVYGMDTGILEGFIYDFTKTNIEGNNPVISRWLQEPQGNTYFIENIPNEIPFGGGQAEVYQMPPIPPYIPLYANYETQYLGVDRYPYRHPGGGSKNRLMVRMGSRDVPNRSIYIIDQELYDYNESIPEGQMSPEVYPFGRASRELHTASKQFAIRKMPVLDSLVYGSGSTILELKADGFLDLIGSDDTNQPADVGFLETNFFDPGSGL